MSAYAPPSLLISTEWIDHPMRRWQWHLPDSIVAALRERHA